MFPASSHLHSRRLLTIAAILFSIADIPAAQHASAQVGSLAYSANSAASKIPDSIGGRVINALTNAAVPRALVSVGELSLLTDAEGRFRFDRPGAPLSGLLVRKPGFSTSPEQAEVSRDSVVAARDPASLVLALWPEAVLVGIVETADHEPLPRISVVVRRSTFDEQGRHFEMAGQKQTDAHGAFRLPLPAGDYVVETQFTMTSSGHGQVALPAAFGGRTSSGTGALIHLSSGEERAIEIRPVVSATHQVTLPLDAADEGSPPRIVAQSGNGSSFTVPSSRSPESNAVQLNLPQGAYILRATRFSRDGMQTGDSSVTVPDHDISGPPLHLTSLPSVPVEVIVESASAQVPSAIGVARSPSVPPGIAQFGLALQPIDGDPTSPFQFGIRPTQGRDGAWSLAAPPGLYRLSAGFAGGWYVRAATSRGSDLLRENLTISPGSSPSPVTLSISNQTGALQGAVTLGGDPCACWVYLVPSGPALPPVIIRQSDASGRFQIADLPTGSYRAVAFPFRHSANLADPETLNSFSTHLGRIIVAVGSSSTLELDAVPARELMR